MDLYAEQILEHSKHPHHSGTLSNPTAQHEELNPSCGDRVHVELRIENGILTDIAWTGSGCAISQAGMSLLSDTIFQQSADDILNLHKGDILKVLGVPVSERRMKCALLGLHTVQNALRVQNGLPLQPWTSTLAPTPS